MLRALLNRVDSLTPTVTYLQQIIFDATQFQRRSRFLFKFCYDSATFTPQSQSCPLTGKSSFDILQKSLYAPNAYNGAAKFPTRYIFHFVLQNFTFILQNSYATVFIRSIILLVVSL